jgi:ribosomal protein L6P/L9E
MINNKLFIITIPSSIKLFLCDNNNNIDLILIKGNYKLVRKSCTNILVNHNKSLIYISDINNYNYSDISKKRFKNIRLNLLFSLKLFIKNSGSRFYKKISLKGVGYKFIMKDFGRSIIQLVVGFSHSIFIRLPKELEIFLIKPTLLYITCINYLKLTSIIQTVKQLKFPEVYKSKGINLEYDKLFLKEGKKAQ